MRYIRYGRKSRFTAPITCYHKTKFSTIYPAIYTSPNENSDYGYHPNLGFYFALILIDKMLFLLPKSITVLASYCIDKFVFFG